VTAIPRIIDLLNPGKHIAFELSGSEASAAFTLRALPKTLRGRSAYLRDPAGKMIELIQAAE
jgi:hypothetical protein